jgi:hypothetical protein
MPDRFNGFLVIMEKDILEEDAQGLMNAIRHFRGVVSVTGHVASASDRIATERAKQEFARRLLDVVNAGD